MLHFQQKIGEGCLIIWESVEELDVLLSEIQNPKTLEEYQQFSSEKRKREYLSVRVALKVMLGEEKEIRYTADGKPYIFNSNYNISISHSNRWIAVFIYPEKKIGIDIECADKKIKKLYKRFLSQKEQESLSNGNNIDQLKVAWSAKEVLYKIIGQQAVDFATQLEIQSFIPEQKGRVKAKHLVSGREYNLKYQISEEYTVVYCIENF